MDSRRIGVDTKAYASGVLTGVKLQGNLRSVFQSSETNDPEISGVSGLNQT
jgi:hypothetical protein